MPVRPAARFISFLPLLGCGCLLTAACDRPSSPTLVRKSADSQQLAVADAPTPGAVR